MRKCFGVSYSPYVRVDMLIEANQVEQMVKTVSEYLYDCVSKQTGTSGSIWGSCVRKMGEIA